MLAAERELDTLSLREGVITYASAPLQFEPGMRYEYCNPGINTAGRLIEVISGMPYEDFLHAGCLTRWAWSIPPSGRRPTS